MHRLVAVSKHQWLSVCAYVRPSHTHTPHVIMGHTDTWLHNNKHVRMRTFVRTTTDNMHTRTRTQTHTCRFTRYVPKRLQTCMRATRCVHTRMIPNGRKCGAGEQHAATHNCQRNASTHACHTCLVWRRPYTSDNPQRQQPTANSCRQNNKKHAS